MQEPVIFKSDGEDIYGVMHRPANKKRRRGILSKTPAVVFCHGFAGNKIEAHRIFVKMARALEKKGIVSLRFDFRGCGDSSGDFKDTTVMDEVEDTDRAINFIKRQPGIDRTKIGIIGLSLGGAVAAYAASRHKEVKALVLWAPAADLVEEAEQIRSENGVQEIKKLKAVDYYGTLLGRPFIKQIPRVQPLLAIKKYRGAALIIQGTRDDSVPLGHSLGFYRAMKKNGLSVERVLIKGANHVFSSYAWEEEVISRTLVFLERYLKDKSKKDIESI